MTIKQFFLVILLAILLVGSATFIIIKIKQPTAKTIDTTIISPTPAAIPLSTWTDEAGFTFQYPQDTLVNQHPEDTTNYANLTLTLPSAEIIEIVMSDNTYKNLTAWAGQNLAIDTTLGEKPAKKIIKDGLTTIACIDNEVLVTITGKDISQITDSWVFVYPTATTPKTTTKPNVSNDSGDVLEEE